MCGDAVLTLREMTSDAQTPLAYIFYVISDRQVSGKKPICVFECMAIVQSRLLEINLQ